MLDNITKKNIDDCRDVLVGKVPDPKSQIEQITLALIYKFMDDMDREAVEKFKGKAKFFTGDFAKFGWRKLFDPSLNGKDMLDLYSEALDKLQTNANIPELFRNIFKNAYLPYKDPATLKMFLKHINEFEYSHSEKLGDAFEYLLSVMGSQGDAGQFRTPRHIIDFIAACLNPQKNETVADPACGTAGFLLSAYKHILKQNTDKRLGDKLTPDQRKKLAENFVGYDISPDMVRLSLVNMYLHGFTTPHIFEYDTLSSEDRWEETFDVILANPPFMTPKGGIRPHKKFGVQANKAEVLFTDYIAEHLNKNGRAGIVVPNGIVATTQTAYKQLRKLLVDDGLIAVVSLPAGCFQPYSGVKTSVLMLDKGLVKKSDHILFIKVSNDGFDLGAQRKEHDKNDLPLALEAFNAYKASISSGMPFDKEKYSSICYLVEKEQVFKNKDIILNGDRYIEGKVSQTEFELVKLGDENYFKIESGGTPSSEIDEYWKGNVSWATLKDLPAEDFITYINSTERTITELGLSKSSAKMLPINSVLVSSRATIGRIAINNIPLSTNQGFKNIVIKDFSLVNPKYLAFALTNKIEEMNQIATGGTFKEISKSAFAEIEIPLPPLDIQEQIVKEIEGYQKIIDGAKMVVDNYKPTISIKPEWEMVELGSVCDFVSGYAFGSNDFTKKHGAKSIKITNVGVGSFVEVDDDYLPENFSKEFAKYAAKEGDIAIALTRTIIDAGIKLCLVTKNYNGALVNQRVALIRPKESYAIKNFIYFLLNTDEVIAFVKEESKTLMQPNLSIKDLAKLNIKLPSIKEQNEIVELIETERQIVLSNKRLITIFEQKIKDKINQVWGIKGEVV
ncbi:MAG: N-6 DNA methylase [Sphingobacteriaceae bacterium]